MQNKTVALIENGSWASTAAKQMKEKLSELKNMTILDTQVSVKSAMLEGQEEALLALTDAIMETL